MPNTKETEIYTAAIPWGISAFPPFIKSTVVAIKRSKSIRGVKANKTRPNFSSLNIYLTVNPKIITIQNDISQKIINHAIKLILIPPFYL